MSLRYVVRALVLAALMPAGAKALGLGDIHLKSALNAPLDAEIDLTASPEEIAGLKVTLATRESFARYGLDYPAYLNSVTLVPAKSTDGRDVLRVHSRDVVTEPFATLLIEANWARGRLVREYTVLLDPPVFTGGGAGAAAAVSLPGAAAPAHAGTVERPSPPPAAPSNAIPTETPAAAQAAPIAPGRANGGSYVVQRGDTLSNIAARNFPNSQRERALTGLYRGNPSAFEGNMNLLHAGATLQIPDAATIAAIGSGTAHSEVGTQYRAWAGAHGRLRLVPPTEPATAGAGPSERSQGGASGAAPAETAALQQRVTTLQGQLSESQRLLELKSAELARLQTQLAQAPVNPGKVAPALPVPATPTLHAARPSVATNKDSGSGLDWLMSNWYLPLLAIGAVLAGLFSLRFLRTRKAQEFDNTLDRLSAPSFEAPPRVAGRGTDTPRGSRADPSFVVEESGSHELPRSLADERTSGHAAHVAVDDTVSGDTAVALDQGDPLAEADFHMAYGLYDQAADLVRIAIAREPQRRDLKLKLLEVFFVWGNKDQFLQLARELSTTREQSLAGEWEKIVIMGRQIAPEDALFSSAGALPGAASAGIDLNLEGGQNRVDFDLLGEPSITPHAASDAVDLDLGAALSDAEATGELRAIGDTGVDFILDDPARGGEATGSTREMPQSHTVTMDLQDPDSESKTATIENLQPKGLDSPTIRQKLDASAYQHLHSADQTAELALDDLGLDLSGATTGNHSRADVHADAHAATHAATHTAHPEEDTGAGLAPTMLSPLSEDTRELLAKAHAAHDTAQMPVSGGSASGTWLFTDKDFSSAMPAVAGGTAAATAIMTAVMPAVTGTHDQSAHGLSDPTTAEHSEGITGQLEALKNLGKGHSVDMNLDSLASTSEMRQPLDLDLGHASEPSDTRFAATQRLEVDKAHQLHAAEPEPATMSEVGTKLDLARAYMDMGDPEGARSILEEVLAEGSASQKTEARRLVDSLPG